MGTRTYYVYRYVLDSQQRCLIWYEDYQAGRDGDFDGVWSDGRYVPVFVSTQRLQSYAQTHGIQVEDNGVTYNFDVVKQWLKKPRLRAMNCDEFLAAWNLLADVSRSVGGDFDPEPDRTLKIYQKMFWGNNLTALTPPGRYYVPFWQRHELRRCAKSWDIVCACSAIAHDYSGRFEYEHSSN
jgi:hypothetical protein